MQEKSLCGHTGGLVLGSRGLPSKSRRAQEKARCPKAAFPVQCQGQGQGEKPPAQSPAHVSSISCLPDTICSLPFPSWFLPARGDTGGPECCISPLPGPGGNRPEASLQALSQPMMKGRHSSIREFTKLIRPPEARARAAWLSPRAGKARPGREQRSTTKAQAERFLPAKQRHSTQMSSCELGPCSWSAMRGWRDHGE